MPPLRAGNAPICTANPGFWAGRNRNHIAESNTTASTASEACPWRDLNHAGRTRCCTWESESMSVEDSCGRRVFSPGPLAWSAGANSSRSCSACPPPNKSVLETWTVGTGVRPMAVAVAGILGAGVSANRLIRNRPPAGRGLRRFRRARRTAPPAILAIMRSMMGCSISPFSSSMRGTGSLRWASCFFNQWA